MQRKADNEFMRLFSRNKTEAQRYREALETIATKIEGQKAVERHRAKSQTKIGEIEFGRAAIFGEFDMSTQDVLKNARR